MSKEGPTSNTGHHKARDVEDFLAGKIDSKNDDAIFQREGGNSILKWWEKILIENKIPISFKEQEKFFLAQMDLINLKSYKPEQRSQDKEYFEKFFNFEEDLLKKDPRKYKEKILGKIFSYVLTKVFQESEILVGDSENIYLKNSFLAHPFDSKKRQVGSVLNMIDERNPRDLSLLAITTQWGHEKTDKDIIAERFRFILSGLEDFGSMTELRYSPSNEGQEMPIFVPLVIIGGDIKNISSLVDDAMTHRFNRASENPVMFNVLKQIQLQLSLFYQFTKKRKEAHDKEMPINEHQRNKNLFIGDNLNNTLSAYLKMKNIFDKILEANEPLIKERSKPDSIHKMILDICASLGEENGISLE